MRSFIYNNIQMKRIFFTCLIFYICINSSISWWNEGHMLVAAVAKLDLQKKMPDAADFVENLTKVLEPMRHKTLVSYIESATWPDLVKTYALKMMDDWHFIDLAVNEDMSDIPYIDPTILDTSLTLIVSKFRINF